MQTEFKFYTSNYQKACLGLFDDNCPQFFAPNERDDYQRFLSTAGEDYYVSLDCSRVVAAYGLTMAAMDEARINWIMVSPQSKGAGVGRSMMSSATCVAQDKGAKKINIAASQHSSAFFAKFGAEQAGLIENGWGEGMHRIDMVLKLG